MTTPVKHDEGKHQFDLMFCPGTLEISKALTFGANKYQDKHNYLRGTGLEYRRLAGSLGRHVLAWMLGEDKDPESGLHPLAHAGANVVMLLNLISAGKGVDDRGAEQVQEVRDLVGGVCEICQTPGLHIHDVRCGRHSVKCACGTNMSLRESVRAGVCFMCRPSP